jgi:hypothetical protein
MATLLQLRTLVSTIIQDDAFTDDMIDAYLNDGVNEIAAGMQSTLGDSIIPPLPKLFTIDTVDTDTVDAYVPMPVTFGRNLQFVAGSNGVEIDICNSMIEFSESYPLMDRDGDVVEVIEYGGNLYYQGIPTVMDELTVHFYRLPVEMSADSDTPDGIPLSFQKKLLVNFACKEIFNLIEDGIEGQKINTTKHTNLFLIALRVFELLAPADSRSLFLWSDE